MLSGKKIFCFSCVLLAFFIARTGRVWFSALTQTVKWNHNLGVSVWVELRQAASANVDFK